MFTPQQIEEQTFDRAVFGGYDMQSVDDFLEPLVEDYTTLYKENAVLKSKLRILVEKLEEYRRKETSMQNALVTAQQNADNITREAERKAAAVLNEAEQKAAQYTQQAEQNARFSAIVRDDEVRAETERLNRAKQAAASFISAMEQDINHHLELLEKLKMMDLTPEKPEPAAVPVEMPKTAVQPAPEAPEVKLQPAEPEEQPVEDEPAASAPVEVPTEEPAAEAAPIAQPEAEIPENAPTVETPAYPAAQETQAALDTKTEDIASEIEQNLEKLVGSEPVRQPVTTYDTSSPYSTKVMRPLHPESITAKFGDLQFGKNYNPNK